MRLSTFAVAVALGLIIGSLVAALIYDWLYDYFGLAVIFVFALALSLAIVLVVVSAILYKRGDARWAAGLSVFIGSTFVFTLGSLGYKGLLNASPVRLSATYYNEGGLAIQLREDWTVKATASGIFKSQDVYGRYRLHGDTVILQNMTVHLGMAELNDTLLLRPPHLVFCLDRERRGVLKDSLRVEKNSLR